ncbi:MAG TPA: hypothetical protein VK638_48360 [Edaphobacter sp.]|nr:hypothetical protein [Edaphobacter sp.]
MRFSLNPIHFRIEFYTILRVLDQSTVKKINFPLFNMFCPSAAIVLFKMLLLVSAAPARQKICMFLLPALTTIAIERLFFGPQQLRAPKWGHGDASPITLAEAIHASTNAPVNYFDAPAKFPDREGRYWDGGISGCNNPVLVAVTEAIVKGQESTNIVALSIGTATVRLPVARAGEQLAPPFVREIVEPGIKNDLSKLATSILDDPPDIATFLAHVMTGGGVGLGTQLADSRIIRMSPLVSPVKKLVNGTEVWSAPSSMTPEQFKNLVNLDFDAVEQTQVAEIMGYADIWVKGEAPNQPIRMNGDTLVRELGQDRFGTAKAAWEAIR